MESYNTFAQVYDLFMEDVPYTDWAKHIEKVWEKYNINPKIVAELGCGTGTLCNYFAKKDIEMIGIDNSMQMLSVAREKAGEEELNILYLLQDMQDFELYGTVDSIYSTCDSMNYILEEDELLQTFKWVNNYLEPEGIFIFDINTQYKYEEILADNTFASHVDGASYIWENYYDEEQEINEYVVTFFIEEEDGRYSRFEEMHQERMYTQEKIISLLQKAGMKVEGVFDEYSFNPVKPGSQRITFIAKEQGKKKGL